MNLIKISNPIYKNELSIRDIKSKLLRMCINSYNQIQFTIMYRYSILNTEYSNESSVWIKHIWIKCIEVEYLTQLSKMFQTTKLNPIYFNVSRWNIKSEFPQWISTWIIKLVRNKWIMIINQTHNSLMHRRIRINPYFFNVPQNKIKHIKL